MRGWRSLLASPTVKKYGGNSLWLVLERAANMAITIVVGVIVARYLGPTRYGLLNYARSFVDLFAIVGFLGLDSIVIRDLVKIEARERDRILGTTFGLSLIGAVCVLLVAAVTAHLFPADPDAYVLIVILSLAPLFQALRVIDFHFQSQVQGKFIVLSQLGAVAASSLYKLLLVALGATIVAFAGSILIESVFLAALLVYFGRQAGLRIRAWSFDGALARQLLRRSWPQIFSGVAVMVNMRIDQVMLEHMHGSTEVGIFAAANTLSRSWYFVPAVVASTFFPMLVTLRDSQSPLYEKRVQMLHDLLFLIAVGAAAVTTIYATPIVMLLFGAGFAGAAPVLAIHVWAGVFVFHGNMRANYLVAEHKQHLGLVYRIGAVAANVGLNYLLIPRYGALGAAWATLLSVSLPVLVLSWPHPVLRKTAIFCLKSYVFPVRLFLYRGRIYQ